MADQGSGGEGSGPARQGGGPPPEYRLPIFAQGPTANASAHGPEEESDPDEGSETAKAEAKTGADLGSATAQGSAGTATGRIGYVGADASASATGTQVDGASAQAGGEADAGVARVDGKTAQDGLVRGSGGASVGSVDAKAKVKAELTREDATLSGKLGASAMVAEGHVKGEIVLTPQRVTNGIIVNGVNAASHWFGFHERMKKIKSDWLNHGIILSGDASAGVGVKADAEAKATTGKDGEGASVSAKAGVALGPGGSVGGKVEVK